jgi:hypothetical protein
MKELAEDPENMDESYEVWLEAAEKALRNFRAEGCEVRKVDVDVVAFADWCAAKGLPLNASSRSQYAADMALHGQD